MNKTEAEKNLAGRRNRCARKRGPMSLQFTDVELRAVSVLASHGRTQETIARDSGLSLANFKRAFEGDEKLRDAWLIGKAIRREQRIDDLEKQSKKGNVRATELLLRYEHGDAGPQTARGGAAVTVNINANTVPPAQDGRSYAALMKRIAKGNAPTLIEHDATPAQPVILDPIEAVKRRQRQERADC